MLSGLHRRASCFATTIVALLARNSPCRRVFEQAAEPLREEDVARVVVCGPDPEAFATAIRTFEEAGFDQLSIHQIGPDQEGFFGFFEREPLPLSAARA
jgi:hypothetical protein